MPAPKRKKSLSLGKQLMRQKCKTFVESTRHTTDEGGVPAMSITENTSIDEFLSNAEASQKSFEAERGSVAITNLGVVREDEIYSNETSSDTDSDDDSFSFIPRKPDWKKSENPEVYHNLETEVFLKWKRRVNRMQNKHPHLPPFEKNLDFWRQLWKIVELSDVVVQVVDARDPLFYACNDLSKYVEQMEGKRSVLLLNKADFLTLEQRQIWAEHFKDSDTKTLFFSAADSLDVTDDGTVAEFNTPTVVEPPTVLSAIKSLAPTDLPHLTIGFVGYPNVGKSSTINRFLQNRRLQVSATPGKTKHYQTQVIRGGQITLVDGPGLVIPNLKMTKAEMILSGILPITTLTDPVAVINQLLTTRIPFTAIVEHYGIMRNCLVRGFKDSKQYSHRESQQLLSALSLMRGFMKPGGIPDESRAAKMLLKDFVCGKLLFCREPPGVDRSTFAPSLHEVISKKDIIQMVDDISLEEAMPELKPASGYHLRVSGRQRFNAEKKHCNRKKREKLRRLYPDVLY